MKVLTIILTIIISNNLLALDFYQSNKITNGPLEADDNGMYMYQSTSHNCNLDSADWTYCIALNGDIEPANPDYDYKKCLEVSSLDYCSMLGGSYVMFKNHLDKNLTKYIERYIYERYKKLIADSYEGDFGLGAMIINYHELITIFLNSPGGSVDDAINIGKLIRKYQLRTSIAQNDECLSSCFIIFMSGVARQISTDFFYDPKMTKYDTYSQNARLGVHRMYYENKAFSELSPIEASLMYKKKYIEIEDYLKSVSTPNFMIDKMNNTQSDDMFIFTKEVLLDAGINSEINNRDIYFDRIFNDRYKGSGMELKDFAIKSQINSIYPDYFLSVDYIYQFLDNLLKKVYGYDYWKSGFESNNPSLNEITEENCKTIEYLDLAKPKQCSFNEETLAE